jgi:predicted DNA-binding ribbon-helix-helix protein
MRPIKRSLTITGHRTSVSLEPAFWEALREIATAQGATVAGLVAEVDAKRSGAGEKDEGGLSGRLRVFVLRYYQKQSRKQR